jgi:hypothetical protein
MGECYAWAQALQHEPAQVATLLAEIPIGGSVSQPARSIRIKIIASFISK